MTTICREHGESKRRGISQTEGRGSEKSRDGRTGLEEDERRKSGAQRGCGPCRIHGVVFHAYSGRSIRGSYQPFATYHIGDSVDLEPLARFAFGNELVVHGEECQQTGKGRKKLRALRPSFRRCRIHGARCARATPRSTCSALCNSQPCAYCECARVRVCAGSTKEDQMQRA